MTNTQLWLSVGIPSVLVILSWLSNNTRLNAVERRLNANERRFDELVQSTNRRFDEVISASHRDFLEIMRAMTALHERVAVV